LGVRRLRRHCETLRRHCGDIAETLRSHCGVTAESLRHCGIRKELYEADIGMNPWEIIRLTYAELWAEMGL
jgi:hypothetical protein